MKQTTLHHEGDHRRTFAFVLETDENPIAVLTATANDYHLASSQITGVGGFARATLGYFDRDRKTYLIVRRTQSLSFPVTVLKYRSQWWLLSGEIYPRVDRALASLPAMTA